MYCVVIVALFVWGEVKVRPAVGVTPPVHRTQGQLWERFCFGFFCSGAGGTGGRTTPTQITDYRSGDASCCFQLRYAGACNLPIDPVLFSADQACHHISARVDFRFNTVIVWGKGRFGLYLDWYSWFIERWTRVLKDGQEFVISGVFAVLCWL